MTESDANYRLLELLTQWRREIPKLLAGEPVLYPHCHPRPILRDSEKASTRAKAGWETRRTRMVAS